MEQNNMKTVNDSDFANRIRRIMHLLSYNQDVSEFDYYDVVAARILLKDEQMKTV